MGSPADSRHDGAEPPEALGFDLTDEQWVRLVGEYRREEPQDGPGSIGDFTLVGEIGRGAQGIVYRAVQPRTGRTVAIKRILRVGSSRDLSARFQREVRAAAALNHPNIVTVYGSEEVDGYLLMAMECIDGVPVDRWAASDAGGSRSPGRTPAEVIRLFIKICGAVHHAHQRGVIHRDLKPTNVLVDSAGEPHILDFGLARLLSDSDQQTLLTQTGAFVGTPAYAAPEQFGEGDGVVDVRSDIYSVGCMLFQALTGRTPLGGRARLADLVAAIRDIDPPAPSSVRPELNRDIDAVVLKSLAKSKADRYQSSAAVADDLRRILNFEPISARHASLASRIVKFARRRRGILAAGIIGAMLAAGLLGALAVYALLVPRWVETHLRSARLELLADYQASSIASTVYWGRFKLRSADVGETFRRSLDRALVEYRAALRLSPWNTPIRREFSVVEAVRNNLPNPLDDPRAAGLFGFLSGDYDDAIGYWAEWEQTPEATEIPDPLVDLALGTIFQFADQPGRAYPRLERAARAFPNTGFITVALADVAIQCGDLRRAEALLTAARTMPRQDMTSGWARVHADLLAATGRDDEAIALYKRMYPPSGDPTRPLEPGSNPIGVLHLAQLWDRRGETETALRIYQTTTHTMPGVRTARAFTDCAHRWWASLSPARRWATVRRIWRENPFKPDAVLGLFLDYAISARRIGRAEID